MLAILKCACRFFHSYLNEMKKINNQFLNGNETTRDISTPVTANKMWQEAIQMNVMTLKLSEKSVL